MFLDTNYLSVIIFDTKAKLFLLQKTTKTYFEVLTTIFLFKVVVYKYYSKIKLVHKRKLIMLELNVQQYQFRLWMKTLEKGGMHKIVQIFRRERFSAKETVCGILVVYQTKLPAFPHTQLVAETTLDWTSPNRLDTYRSGHVETVQCVQLQTFSRVCWDEEDNMVSSVVISASTGTR